jgi:hypothetical protein
MRLGASSSAIATVLSKPRGPVMSTRTPPGKGPAAIQASYGRAWRCPAAATAASMRSLRAAEIPLQATTVRGPECGHLARQAAGSPPLFRGGTPRAHSRRRRHRLPALRSPGGRSSYLRLRPANRLPRQDRRLWFLGRACQDSALQPRFGRRGRRFLRRARSPPLWPSSPLQRRGYRAKRLKMWRQAPCKAVRPLHCDDELSRSGSHLAAKGLWPEKWISYSTSGRVLQDTAVRRHSVFRVWCTIQFPHVAESGIKTSECLLRTSGPSGSRFPRR